MQERSLRNALFPPQAGAPGESGFLLFPAFHHVVPLQIDAVLLQRSAYTGIQRPFLIVVKMVQCLKKDTAASYFPAPKSSRR